MKFNLTAQEIKFLEDKGILIDESRDYADDEALDLLDRVREIEVSYAQFTAGAKERLYSCYGNLADKIYSQIPEE